MAADLGFIPVGCLVISVAEKGVLFTCRLVCSKPFAQSLHWRSCVASFALKLWLCRVTDSVGLHREYPIPSKNGMTSPLHFLPVLRGNSLKLSQYFVTKLPHCILSHPVFLLFQVIDRNFSIWNFTPNYGQYFQLLSCIFLNTGSQPLTLKLLSFRKLNCFSCSVWVCAIAWYYLLSAVQGFRLICSASLGMQLYANFPV